MAIINCPECGNSISTKAVSCVKCGFPLSEIFICPECNNIEVKSGSGACSKCGCPITDDTNGKQVTNTTNNTSNENGQQSVAEYIRIAEKIVFGVLAHHTFGGSGILSESGSPISDLRKVNAAKTAFSIPKEDNVFFVASGNIWGGINESSKGFALTSRGIYGVDDHKKQMFFWYDQFAQLKISIFMSYVKLGEYEFNVTDTKKIKNMLLDLQDEVLAHMD